MTPIKSAAPLSVNAWLRYDLVTRLLAAITGANTVVEIGAGMGAVGVRLAQHYQCYVGVEPDQASFNVAYRRIAATGRGRMIHGDASSLPRTLRADVVCAFEVLEHVEDDEAVLRLWRTFLRPGATLLISVPAWQRRFGPSDARVGHHRRYDRDQLRQLLLRSGYEDVRIFIYGFPLGYVLEAAWDVAARLQRAPGSIEERTSESGRWIQPPAWLNWGAELMSLPFRVIQRAFVRTDLGTGFVAIACKPAVDRESTGVAHVPSTVG